MEMVAASKMKKAQDQMTMARPYADKILNVISHLAHAHPEYESDFLSSRDVSKKRVYCSIFRPRTLWWAE